MLIHDIFLPLPHKKPITFYQISDAHLNWADSLCSAKEQEIALQKEQAWENIRRSFCELYHEPFLDEALKPAPQLFKELLQEAEKGDFLLLTGDIMDEITPANLRFLENALTNFSKPFVFLCGNHEDKVLLPDDSILSPAKNDIQLIQFPSYALLALNNASRHVSSAQTEALRKACEENDTVLLAMHIPILTPELMHTPAAKEEYYWLNDPNCPEENLSFIAEVKRNRDKIAAVLAGHLHFGSDTEICPGLRQIVASQGITGNMNRYCGK